MVYIAATGNAKHISNNIENLYISHGFDIERKTGSALYILVVCLLNDIIGYWKRKRTEIVDVLHYPQNLGRIGSALHFLGA